MDYNLLLQTEAVLEIREAFKWYEKLREGLGYELIEEIEDCYKKLITDPERYSFINQTYRRIKTSRFPYLLVYEIEDNNVIIISVRHIKRKP